MIQTKNKKFIVLITIVCAMFSCNKENLNDEKVNHNEIGVDDFTEISKRLEVSSPLNSAKVDSSSMGYWLDNLQYTREASVWDQMFLVAVFDKESLNPWHSQERGDFEHLNYQNNVYMPQLNKYCFYFENTTEKGVTNFMDFVNEVPKDNYVLIYTFRGNNISGLLSFENELSENYYGFLNTVGANADSLKKYPNGFPYILLFKKGDLSTVQERFYKEDNATKILCLKTTIRNTK